MKDGEIKENGIRLRFVDPVNTTTERFDGNPLPELGLTPEERERLRTDFLRSFGLSEKDFQGIMKKQETLLNK